MAVTVQSGSSAPARRKPVSLQDWLETRGAVVAFVIAAVSMMLRGAEFYSGGAFNLAASLGPHGTTAFNILSGLGLAVGCELVGSIAGRDMLYNQAEALEVDEQRGLTKPQRAARKKAYEVQAKRAGVFMWLGFLFSFAAAVYYSVTTTHASGLAIGLEVIIAGALEAVLVYLGVFKQSHNNPAKEAEALGHDLLRDVMITAAQRIRDGVAYSMQDVRLVARAIKDKREAERFEAAYMQGSPDEPIWTTRDIMTWLGDPTSEALRKRINRKLAGAMAHGGSVWKDSKTGAFQIAKGEAGRLFMDDYLSLARVALATKPGQTGSAKPQAAATAAAAPETRPTAPQAPDNPGTTPSASEAAAALP